MLARLLSSLCETGLRHADTQAATFVGVELSLKMMDKAF
jgi:hypothetical protein